MKFNAIWLSRISFKIFLVFWSVTILMVIGSNVVIHFFDYGPDKHLSPPSHTSARTAGDRLMREVVSDAINYNYEEVKAGMKKMPEWMTGRLVVLNDQGEEILGKPVSAEIRKLTDRISEKTPLIYENIGSAQYYGRLFRLNDGTTLRLFVYTQDESYLGWRVFFSSFWPILLINVIISGAACYFLARYITRDLQVLKEATQRIANGEWDIQISKHFCARSDEMSELGLAFDDMVNKLQKSMLEQKRLIKDVSHELRSPLARLQVALALAQQKANSEITGELNRIKEAADYLNDLINDILSLPITEQKGWELSDTMDICSLVKSIVAATEYDALKKGVKLKVVDNLHEALIQTRGHTLVGVFDNILRNALRYTPADSELTIRMTQMPGDVAQVIVSDQGPGVAEEHLNNIFEPFFRTDEARDRKSGGYGLGLAIAKRTVLLHGGTMKAMNNPGGGLSIVFTLPQIADV